jgi:hypothetical protein
LLTIFVWPSIKPSNLRKLFYRSIEENKRENSSSLNNIYFQAKFLFKKLANNNKLKKEIYFESSRLALFAPN